MTQMALVYPLPQTSHPFGSIVLAIINNRYVQILPRGAARYCGKSVTSTPTTDFAVVPLI
jgi:hypothetical protein